MRNAEKASIAVLGAGSWGTALAVALAHNGHRPVLWGRDTVKIEEIRRDRENKRYLAGVPIPESVEITDDQEYAVRDRDMVVYVVPAQAFRGTFAATAPMLRDDTVVVNCAKGIEIGTQKRISEIAEEIRPELPFVVLSGPSHAEEVGQFLPTTLTAASVHQECAEFVQDAFMSDAMRVYTNDDVIGVEIGGALKNIIALGAGISDGMGYGDNAKAALMTRGLAEMARLGEKLGGSRMTFMGLAGLGDLIVTCTSMHSRNRRCGIMIGEGLSPSEAIEKVGMVVEGMHTAEAAYTLAKEHGVEMPVTEQLYEVIQGTISGPEAVRTLMKRKKKNESKD